MTRRLVSVGAVRTVRFLWFARSSPQAHLHLVPILLLTKGSLLRVSN